MSEGVVCRFRDIWEGKGSVVACCPVLWSVVDWCYAKSLKQIQCGNSVGVSCIAARRSLRCCFTLERVLDGSLC